MPRGRRPTIPVAPGGRRRAAATTASTHRHLRIRPATPADLAAINEVTLAAKAHWGYRAELLAAWRDSLLTTPASLQTCPTLVAVTGASLVGVVQLDPSAEPCELVACWVAPVHMRRGIGGALLSAALSAAACAGHDEIHIDADPHAEPFYLAQRAMRVGSVLAPIDGQPDRVRPQLRLSTRRQTPAPR